MLWSRYGTDQQEGTIKGKYLYSLEYIALVLFLFLFYFISAVQWKKVIQTRTKILSFNLWWWCCCVGSLGHFQKDFYAFSAERNFTEYSGTPWLAAFNMKKTEMFQFTKLHRLQNNNVKLAWFKRVLRLHAIISQWKLQVAIAMKAHEQRQ